MLSPEDLRYDLTQRRPDASWWPRRAQPHCPGDTLLLLQQLRTLLHEPELRLTYHYMDATQEHRLHVAVVKVHVQEQRLHTRLCQGDVADKERWFARCKDGRWRLADGLHGPLADNQELCHLEIPMSAERTGRLYPRPEPVTLELV